MDYAIKVWNDSRNFLQSCLSLRGHLLLLNKGVCMGQCSVIWVLIAFRLLSICFCSQRVEENALENVQPLIGLILKISKWVLVIFNLLSRNFYFIHSTQNISELITNVNGRKKISNNF